MLLVTLLRLINHVLKGEDWARHKLQPYAGESVSLSVGSVIRTLTIGDEGFLVAGSPHGKTATVSVTFPLDVVPHLLSGTETFFSAAKISGSADFAETLAFVFRNLRWDVESDVAYFTGDIVARRLSRLGQAFAIWSVEAFRGVAGAAAEYIAEEGVILVNQQQLQIYCTNVDLLRDSVARLEKRLARLESQRGVTAPLGKAMTVTPPEETP